MNKNTSLSVVVPVYNDQEVLPELLKRLVPAVKQLTDDYEIILIDDGSKDKSFSILKKLNKEYQNIKIIKFARNFGQQNSIAAGFKNASKDYIVLMDSDLQDRPEDIHKLIDAMEKDDTDMAIARWVTREDSFFKKSVSNLFFYVSRSITGIRYEKGLGAFRVIRKTVLEQIIDIPENTGTVLSLIFWAGIDYSIVDLNRDARFAGTSGYNLKKMLQLTADRIFSYSLFPIRMATRLGFLLAGGSFLWGLYLIIRYFFGSEVMTGYTSMMTAIAFLFGMTFIFLGIVGEYLGRIYIESKNRPKFIISRIIPPSEEK